MESGCRPAITSVHLLLLETCQVCCSVMSTSVNACVLHTASYYFVCCCLLSRQHMLPKLDKCIGFSNWQHLFINQVSKYWCLIKANVTKLSCGGKEWGVKKFSYITAVWLFDNVLTAWMILRHSWNHLAKVYVNNFIYHWYPTKSQFCGEIWRRTR